jgi:hypothetical protein
VENVAGLYTTFYWATSLIMKGVVSRTTRYVHKRAAIGLSGVRRALIDAVNRLSGAKQFTCFDDVKVAKDWLTEE